MLISVSNISLLSNFQYVVDLLWALAIFSLSVSAYVCWVGMWRSSHLNSTTFELWTFSADSKFVTFFTYPWSNSSLRSTRSAPHVYTHHHRPPEQPIEQMRIACSLKGPKIILDMADRHISKDGPFRILGNALTYLPLDFFSITFHHFLYHRHVNVWLNSHLHSHLHSNRFVLWNSHSTNANFSWLHHIPNAESWWCCINF